MHLPGPLGRRALSAFLSVALALASFPVASGSAVAVSPNLVISQIYGGGGNTSAPYQNDFIEIFNRASVPATLAGLSLQYASNTGAGNFGGTSAQITELPAVILAPGQYFLVREAAGTSCLGAPCGAPLPAPDATDSTPIAMAAGAGKVALVVGTLSLGCNGGSTPCTAAQLALIVDLIGYGNANFFEGAAAPTLSNTLAAVRGDGGCTDTDNNAADFAAAPPAPRNTASPVHTCGGDQAPSVSSTTPENGATNVPLDSDITVTFSEDVTVTGSWYDISCTASGAHTASVSGGPSTFTLDPDADFSGGETCSVTVFASQVSDQDTDDPPDNMDADHTWSFTTVAPPTRIREVQGAAHISPKRGENVTNVQGIVTVKRPSSVYIQDPDPDADDATSEAILVFGSATSVAQVGDLVSVSGRVVEFRPGGASSGNLTTTEISTPGLSVTVISSANALPPATIIGAGGRTPSTTVIEDDATGSVETSGVFDPAQDGIDFWESLEAMLLTVADAVAVGPTNAFGEIPVISESAPNGIRTSRGGVVIRADDFNPERILLDDAIVFPSPNVNVGDDLDGVIGVLDYSFGNFKLLFTQTPTVTPGGIAREVTAAPSDHQIAVAAFNVENLDPGDGPAKFDALAQLIVTNLRSPDLIALEEVQDNNGAFDDSVTDASVTLSTLVGAIQSAGGPTYEFRQIDPVDDQDGGQPGGNIRVAFLYRTDRGLSFIDRPGGGSTTATTVVTTPSGPELSASPGRIDPTNSAFDDSRKPLAGEFKARGKTLFVVANHFNSKGGDEPLFGHSQPPVRSSEVQRSQQATIVADFVGEILDADPDANVIVLGDLNDFQFSESLAPLRDAGLTFLVEGLPESERYTYVFDGNSQVLDHILLSQNLSDWFEVDYDVVHVNSEFADQASDHEPQVARLDLRGRPTPKD